MNIKKDVPIYVLSVSILAASLIFATQNKSTVSNEKTPASTFVTEEKYKSDLAVVLAEVIKLQGRVKTVEGCLSDTTRTLTMRSQVLTWCP